MSINNKKVNKQEDVLSKRVDTLEIALLMLLNSLTSVKSFKIGDNDYNVIGRIPERTLKMIEDIIVKNKK